MNVSSPPIDSDDNGFVVGVSVVQDALNMFQTASLDTTGSSQDKVLVDASIIKSLQKLVVYAPNGVGTRVLCEIGTLHKILRFLDYDAILKSVVFVSKTFWKAAKKAAQENLREIQDGASEDFGQRLETHMLQQQQLQQALQVPPFPPLYRLKSAHEIHLYDMELPSRGPYEVSSDGRVAILDEHDRCLRIFDAANGREIVSEPAAQKEVKKWDFGTRGTLVQRYQWPELLWKGGYLFLRGPNKIIIWNEKNVSLHGIVDLEAIGENSWTDWDVAPDGTMYVVNAFDRGTGKLQRGEIVSWDVHGVRQRVSFAWWMEHEYEDVNSSIIKATASSLVVMICSQELDKVKMYHWNRNSLEGGCKCYRIRGNYNYPSCGENYRNRGTSLLFCETCVYDEESRILQISADDGTHKIVELPSGVFSDEQRLSSAMMISARDDDIMFIWDEDQSGELYECNIKTNKKNRTLLQANVHTVYRTSKGVLSVSVGTYDWRNSHGYNATNAIVRVFTSVGSL